MESKSTFMVGLSLKPTPKIVVKNDNKFNRLNDKSFISKQNKNSICLEKSVSIQNTNSVLSGNSLKQNSNDASINKNHNFNHQAFQNKYHYDNHVENIVKRKLIQKPISLLQKTPVKMQSILKNRSILNNVNSNLLNQFSNNQLINSLLKLPVSSNCSLNLSQDKNNNLDKIDEKVIKVIKLCVTKLEFSSPLFRRISCKMNFLYSKSKYDLIRNYEKYCSTSNKSVLKQVMIKGHTLKYKPSRGRSRMLRSNEIVDGKVMISWHRSTYVHVYTFNKRQRLRRYRQISMDLGFEHKTLQIMYGLKKVTLPRIIDCPYCKKKLNPDLGHYCVVAKKTKKIKKPINSILKSHQQAIKKETIQTSDYVSNESNSSLELALNSTFSSINNNKFSLNDSKINLCKLSSINNEEIKRCPTLLLDSSNFKTNTNSISNVIVRRMGNQELKKMSKNKVINADINDLQVKKVNSLPVKNLIKCKVIDQHNFDVSSMENGIKIVFK